LDGPGQLVHLDSLLSIPELDNIQWVPGAGNPDEWNWPEVYKKIRDAGKLIHLQKGLKSLIGVADQIGTAEGIVTMHGAHISEKDEVEEVLRAYGVE
jgi:5-methyltetrahydrofolate--homocysteine methyltransferase